MRTLRDIYLKPWKVVTSETELVRGPPRLINGSTLNELVYAQGAIMPSHNEVDGLPSHGNSWLLRDVLRKVIDDT